MSDANVTKLATAAGVSEQSISEEEKNVIRKLDPNEVEVISKVLGKAQNSGLTAPKVI